ncbi:MAG: phosphomannomutase/phosphoglucomutase [Kangiellaceae bacterium]
MSYSVPYLILCVLTIIFVAIVQYYLVVIEPASKRNSTFVNVTMTSYMELVLNRLDSIGDSTQTVLSEPSIIETVNSGTPEEISRLEKRLANRLPLVDGVRILDSKTHDVDATSVPPITNVTLQLMRNLETNNKVMHEAINAGQKDQYVAVLVKIGDTSKVALVGVNYDIFAQALPKERLVPGYYEFLQNFANQNRTITSMGDPSLKVGDPMGIARLNSTQWRVAFWPANPDDFSSDFELILFFGGLVMVLSLVAIGGFIGLRNLHLMVRSDASSFLRWLLDSAKEDKPLIHSDFQLQIFSDMSQTLTREGFEFDPARESSKRVKKANAELDMISGPESNGSLIASLRDNNSGLEVVENDTSLEMDIDEAEIPESTKALVPDSIFRAYDIRGIVGDTLNYDIVKEIGRAIGSEAFEKGEQRVVVARDGRLSGPELIEALKEGLCASGRDVIDIGEVPTPLLYFATHYLDSSSGVVLTGSHNPKDYNGLKIVIGGHTLSGEEILSLKKRIDTGNLVQGEGSMSEATITQDYISQITGDVALVKPLKVAVDCGNGVAGKIAPQLLQALGCEVIGLYCKVDGTFPNHHPDPSKPENLKELIELVKTEEADIGLAFDGDGDRLGVVDSQGNIIWPDRQMMLYSMDVLSRNPGADIIYDVKCTKNLAKIISSHGGKPIMWKTGHSLVKAKMHEVGAALAGECSGHIFFKERWYGFDDALYTAARLLEILAGDDRNSTDLFSSLPDSLVTPELNVSLADDKKHDFVKKLVKQGAFGKGKLIAIDGARVEFQDGWGLVRASNTTPNLVIRFEADNEEAMERIKTMFKQQMLMIDSSLVLDF